MKEIDAPIASSAGTGAAWDGLQALRRSGGGSGAGSMRRPPAWSSAAPDKPVLRLNPSCTRGAHPAACKAQACLTRRPRGFAHDDHQCRSPDLLAAVDRFIEEEVPPPAGPTPWSPRCAPGPSAMASCSPGAARRSRGQLARRRPMMGEGAANPQHGGICPPAATRFRPSRLARYSAVSDVG